MATLPDSVTDAIAALQSQAAALPGIVLAAYTPGPQAAFAAAPDPTIPSRLNLADAGSTGDGLTYSFGADNWGLDAVPVTPSADGLSATADFNGYAPQDVRVWLRVDDPLGRHATRTLFWTWDGVTLTPTPPPNGDPQA